MAHWKYESCNLEINKSIRDEIINLQSALTSPGKVCRDKLNSAQEQLQFSKINSNVSH